MCMMVVPLLAWLLCATWCRSHGSRNTRVAAVQCGCAAGGVPPKPPKGWKGKDGNDKHNRVDSYGSTANGAWRGSHLPGCSSMTYWINTGDLLCPRCAF